MSPRRSKEGEEGPGGKSENMEEIDKGEEEKHGVAYWGQEVVWCGVLQRHRHTRRSVTDFRRC